MDCNWIDNEIKRLCDESIGQNKCILCSIATNKDISLPDFPCGLIKSQAALNKKNLEKSLNKKAINTAYKKYFQNK